MILNKATQVYDWVIMCGGEGNRLRPFTYITPKPFLTTNNISPFEYIIQNINRNKTNHIYVALKYKYKIAKKIINNKSNSKIKIFLERETSGTAGCLRHIIKKKISKDFMVMNGDIFAKINFCKMMDYHKKKKNDITVGIAQYQLSIPYAILKRKNQKSYFHEKPVLKMKINSGVYSISKKFALNFFKKNDNRYVNMTDVINKAKKIGIYNVGKKWIDIGHINDFKKAYQKIKQW